jgi:multiple sugar transport system permease protein
MSKKKRRSDFWSACLFLAPNFLGFSAFVAIPVIFSIVMAFTNWDITLHNRCRPDDTIQWVWLRNFYDLLTHPEFWKYLGNTLFLMMTIPVGIAGSLLLAVLLTRKLRSDKKTFRWGLALMSLAGFTALGLLLSAFGYGIIALVFCILAGAALALGLTTGATVYRTLFYLPSFTSGVAVYLLWKQMYNPLRGPINVTLTPVLSSLAETVNTTPAGLWSGIGYGLWIVALVGVVWLGYCTLRNWIWGEFGVGTVLISLVALAAGALILYGLGLVSLNLPAMASDGLEPPQWLTDVDWAKPAIMIMALWMAVGSNNMLLFIAGISNVPPALYEAADIDGASRWQRFWHITWPQLAPTTFFIVIMSVIGGIQGGFEQAKTMTNGGPFGATTTLSYYVYREGFETLRMGYASSIAWVIFILIFGMTLFNYKFGNRYVNE